MTFRFSIIILSLFLACNPTNKPERPDNLIPEDKMAQILYDVIVLNAAKGSAKTVLENSGIMPEDYVFEKFGIDSLQFAKSNEYYSYDSETYDAIITKVDTMVARNKRIYQAKIDAEMERRKRERDSLNKLNDSLIKSRTSIQPKVKDSLAKAIRKIEN